MAPKKYVVTTASPDSFRRKHNETIGHHYRPKRTYSFAPMYVAKIGSNGLPAGSTSAPGEGVGTIYKLDGDNNYIDASIGDYTIFHIANSLVAPGSFVPVWHDLYGEWYTGIADGNPAKQYQVFTNTAQLITVGGLFHNWITLAEPSTSLLPYSRGNYHATTESFTIAELSGSTGASVITCRKSGHYAIDLYKEVAYESAKCRVYETRIQVKLNGTSAWLSTWQSHLVVVPACSTTMDYSGGPADKACGGYSKEMQFLLSTGDKIKFQTQMLKGTLSGKLCRRNVTIAYEGTTRLDPLPSAT